MKSLALLLALGAAPLLVAVGPAALQARAVIRPLQQTFLFDEWTDSNGLEWPWEIQILHGDKPYFTLTIEKFEAGGVP